MKSWVIQTLKPLEIKEIIKIINGKILSGDSKSMINGISTDSRTIQKGELFIPIRGEYFDGHDFIPHVIERGAAGALIRKGYRIESNRLKDFILMEVADPRYAMGELAKYYYRKYPIPVIAITGSNGKTSTKDMIAAILSRKYNILKSEGSFNNDIGIPLTLFKLTGEEQLAVLEMGMNHYGEIRRLVDIVPPKIGVVTNIAEAHLEFFGSLDNIAKAKFELLERMTNENIAILNADDPRVYDFANIIKARPVYFGLNSKKAEFAAQQIRFITEPYGLEFQLKVPRGLKRIYIPVLGEHHVYNAVAAAATVWQIEPDLELITEGLAKYQSPKMRMQIIPLGTITLINDAYNANPKSMKAALDTFNQLPCQGKKIAILGDMLELGELQKKAHWDIGNIVAEIGVNYLITVGELGAQIGQSAIESGMNQKKVYISKDKPDAVTKLMNILQDNDLILVKGSRKLKLEELVDEFIKRMDNRK